MRLITSAVTLSEVIHLKGKPQINQRDNEKIRDFFRNPYIIVRNLDRETANLSRKFIWENSLKPKDAIHLATAVRAGVSLLHSFDGDLHGVSNIFGNPKITIEEPSMPQQMTIDQIALGGESGDL